MVENYKAGFVGVMGFPNVGKSTLVNALIGEKVSIVTSKPQTTRQRVFGIYNSEMSQIIFVDLPGATERPGEINDFIRNEFKDGIASCEVLLVVDDISDRRKEKLLEFLKSLELTKPVIVVVNKIDAVGGTQRDERIGFWRANGYKTVYISALKLEKSDASELLSSILEYIPKAQAPLYDQETYTTQNLRDIAREVIREKCFEVIHQEIPYGLGVKCLEFEEGKDITRIFMEIIVSKDNHKPMVVGSGGKTLKRIGMLARIELEKLMDKKVYLNLHVQARPNWTKNKNLMKELGYGNESRA